ncbi:Isoprenoid synthase domain containing protein [Amanita muscaria]
MYWGWLKYFLGLRPYFILPDIVSHCKYPVACNPHCEEQVKASLRWTADLGNQDEDRRRYFAKIKLGELAALVYPTADALRFRISADWMNYIFVIDDWLDELDVDGNRQMEGLCMAAMRDPINFRATEPGAIMTKSWCARLEENSSVACKERMMDAMLGFFSGLREQASHREKNYIPSVEEYIAVRRFTIGAVPAMVLIEFCGGYFLPDHVYNHPVIKSLQQAAIDHICWVNDLVSYNVEQARGDTHNLITIGMRTKGWTLQQAVDFVGKNCNECVDRFERDRLLLPSWDPDTDKLASKYVKGLQSWISIGHLYWSFATARYLGNEGLDIMEHRVVKLYPKLARTVS